MGMCPFAATSLSALPFFEMAQAEMRSRIPNCDAYFDSIQSKKKLPNSLQESLTAAFAQIPASSFPEVPGGKGYYLLCIAIRAF